MYPCRLCGAVAPLLASHVLPAFVFKALKGRAPTGHIRQTDNPNRRVQDGVTQPWLCAACESRFSAWERAFANEVFHPWNNGVTFTRYSEWLLKFCVSVSWRVLIYSKGRNQDAVYTQPQEAACQQAERTWREFLLDQVAHPGPFTQQFVIFDLIESTTVSDLPDNINRYMMGAVSMDIVGSESSMWTWAKLGRFQLFGTIQANSKAFAGTKVHVRDGTLKPGTSVIPAGLIDLYREKAVQARSALASMSDAQIAKIDAAVEANIEKLATSPQFAAMQADAKMFGEQVILRGRTKAPKARS